MHGWVGIPKNIGFADSVNVLGPWKEPVWKAFHDVIGCDVKIPSAENLPCPLPADTPVPLRDDGTPKLIPDWRLGSQKPINKRVIDKALKISLKIEVKSDLHTRDMTLYLLIFLECEARGHQQWWCPSCNWAIFQVSQAQVDEIADIRRMQATSWDPSEEHHLGKEEGSVCISLSWKEMHAG